MVASATRIELEITMPTKCIHWACVLCAFILPAASALHAQIPTNTPPPLPTATPGQPADASDLPSPPYAIVVYPAADPTAPSVSVVSPCVNGISALVGLVPDQVIHVVVQYPPDFALKVINLEAPDGGIILPPTAIQVGTATTVSVNHILQDVVPLVRDLLQNVPIPATPNTLTLAVSADGTLSFSFIATHAPGKNQISLRDGAHELGLQFWIVDAADPQANPPAITPMTPYPSATE